MEIVRGSFAFEGIVTGEVFLDKKKYIDEGITAILDEKDVENEVERFERALELSKESLEDLRTSFAGKMNEHDLEIITAHMMILDDPVYVSDIKKSIKKDKLRAEEAVRLITNKYVKMFKSIQNPEYRQKELDIKDVGKRITGNLDKRFEDWKKLDGKILVTKEIFPTELLNIYHLGINIKGIVMEYGGETSHLAILAKALEIPTLMGIKNIFSYNWGKDIILDTTEINSCVIIEPDEKTKKEYEKLLEKFRLKKEEIQRDANLPTETLDGEKVSLYINVSGDLNSEEVKLFKPDGIGLLRTELLYMKNTSFPDEENQFKVYSDIVEKFDKDSSIVIRTLDIGADKQLPYFKMKNETNSFLGLRGIRFSLQNQDIFLTQLKAILRAAYNRNVKIMYPMVTNISELREANKLLERAKNELKEEKKLYKEDIEIGVMIEVPSIVMMADVFAQEVDFFSIGTNDLTQYILATDRLSETVSSMYDCYNPAVLRSIAFVKKAADLYGKKVSVCGEMAGDTKAIVAFLSMGIKDLSMVGTSILTARSLIRSLNYEKLKEIKEKILLCHDSKEVKEILIKYIN
ncbi:phosphoenolpyruvate--protein phosphotransferase [uncultured Fusobacterium sp.]|uniref:phosphoenolpyruvate--protein phosphotransferase n=1 Tax=uncultured Fusobacterium sp. TaxID=159267 RepID=UPI0025D4BCAB|nr:phosphoenolpyruvate--protein phosphotransferase [uncultured Fusobacterium sp.]